MSIVLGGGGFALGTNRTSAFCSMLVLGGLHEEQEVCFRANSQT